MQNNFSRYVQVMLDDSFYYRWFQYRFLHRILPVENYLKKNTCTFCGNDTETIEQNFTTSTFTLVLWNQLVFTFIMLPPKDSDLWYPIHNRGIFAHFSQHLTHIMLIK